MKYLSTFITLLGILLLFSNTAHSQWRESLEQGWEQSKEYGQKGWEQSKEYGQKGWDSTKDAWDSANEHFSTPEKTPQQSQADQKEARFREIWSQTFAQLNKGVVLVDDIKEAPAYSLFSEDKRSLKKDLNAVLDKTLVLLEDKSINDYRYKIDQLNQQINTSRKKIAQYREDKIVAPKSHSIKLTQDVFEEKIVDEKTNIQHYQNSMDSIKIHFKDRLQEIGVVLTLEQVDILLSRVDADDIIQMSVVFDVLKQITTQLMQLTQDSGENIKQAKKYYGMHVVLLELVIYMQQQYIDTVDTVYIKKIDAIIRSTIKTRNNALRYLSEETDNQRIVSYQNNINALDLTLKTAKLYKKNLTDQKVQVEMAQKVVRKDLNLSQNTYDTVEISADLLSVLKNSKNSFDALMSLQVPQIVPFENIKMQQKYEELSDLLKT
ncbi:MAG: hypothetical protein KAI17_02095 [Thiotrichaceae bacterium]|nr:hypothetical protein [Thiotrichaceae bacterium]